MCDNDNNRRNPTQNENIDLVSEVNGQCPLCGAKLMYEKENSTYKNYEIVHIYPHSPSEKEKKVLNGCKVLYIANPDEKSNLIAMCISCHNKFDNPRTKHEYLFLCDLKLQIKRSKELKMLLTNNHHIQNEIQSIIASLAGLDEKSFHTFTNYNPVTVDEKLKNPLLLTKVRSLVQPFYTFVDNQFKSFNLNNSKYSLILNSFKNAYLELAATKIDEQRIFDLLVEWLMEKSGNDERIANEVMISYFIQHCEVFDVITK